MLACTCTLLAGCNTAPIQGTADKPSVTIPAKPDNQTQTQTQQPAADSAGQPSAKPDNQTAQPSPQPNPQTAPKTDKPQGQVHGYPIDPATTPDSITVLVNKESSALPETYKPADLENDPNLPFIFSGYDEKRLLRKPAAQALEKLFAAAKKDGINLAGVSGFRSYALQKSLFDSYVKQQGETEARRYSAVPGHSEHQTGLAIDVSGSTGACAAEDCFGDTPEAKWLAQHAQEYGYIIRYPKGKEAITGYAYEPWHIRYVGVELAKEVTSKGLTLEEYFAK
jgi:D-alanyl-D-alanine carboxypeptidase